MRNPDNHIRIIQVRDGQCGSYSIFIDVKENHENETRYSINCDKHVPSNNFVSKVSRTFDGKILKKVVIYNSSSDGDSLTSIDRLVLKEIPKISQMDYQDCKNVTETLKRIKSLYYNETLYPNEKRKSWFKKNF